MARTRAEMLTRLNNIAEDAGKTLEQLAQMTDRELLKLPNLGPLVLRLLRELHGTGPRGRGIARKPGAPSHDDTAREVIGRWLAPFGDVFSPGARAAALMTISRVAAELAEAELAKLPDLFEDRGDA